ncbi:MAG: DsbA family protein [Gemmatimonadales bacterium]
MLVRLRAPVDAGDHALGPSGAPVTLVMYGDYECPWSCRAHPVVEAARAALKGRVRVVYRSFPLTRLHPHAQQAAEVAEAAGDRGRFWPMHDLLFRHPDALRDSDLVRYAVSLGLDPEWVAMALRVHLYAGRVQRHFLGGVESGVTGTPSFFINESRYDGVCDVPSLVVALQGAWYEGRRASALCGGADLRLVDRRRTPMHRSRTAGRRTGLSAVAGGGQGQ